MNKTGIILLSSALTVVLCLSLVVGATFALFAGQASTNIAVTSGKVQVEAGIREFHMYTRSENGNNVNDEWLSGKAHEQSGTITLSNMAPYDGVTFDIDITSSSTVAIKWQVQLTFEGDSELYSALKVDVEGIDLVKTESARASNWTLLVPNEGEQAVTKLNVTIELLDSGKLAEGKNCSITVTVFAIQANATTTDPTPLF